VRACVYGNQRAIVRMSSRIAVAGINIGRVPTRDRGDRSRAGPVHVTSVGVDGGVLGGVGRGVRNFNNRRRNSGGSSACSRGGGGPTVSGGWGRLVGAKTQLHGLCA